jgi:transcription elongation factor Elf1
MSETTHTQEVKANDKEYWESHEECDICDFEGAVQVKIVAGGFGLVASFTCNNCKLSQQTEIPEDFERSQ